MKQFVQVLILCLMSAPVYACSCWVKYLPLDHPQNPRNKDYFIFKIISGDAELDAIKRKTGKAKTYRVEVLDSGSSDRIVGERLDLVQESHQCAFGLLPVFHYKYMGNSKGKDINLVGCDTKLSPYDGDQTKFEEWISKQKVIEND